MISSYTFSSYFASKNLYCTVDIHIHKNKRTKLDPRAEKCVFFGYRINKKGYRCHNPIINRTYVTMDVDFLENEPYF
jgi:hypothetical protein